MAAVSLAAVSCGCAGQPQVSLQGYRGTAIVSADGRTLIVGPYGRACGGTVTAIARESRVQVSLFLRYVWGGPACRPGEGALALVPAQRIRLHAPLGRRKLVDGETATATPWLSARLILRPRLIPAGFRSVGLLPWISSSLYTGGARPAACIQIYQLRNSPEEFEIIQSAVGLRPRHGGEWKPVWVRGHPGRAAAGMVTWREHGLTDLISASNGLSTSQLITIANSAATRAK